MKTRMGGKWNSAANKRNCKRTPPSPQLLRRYEEQRIGNWFMRFMGMSNA